MAKNNTQVIQTRLGEREIDLDKVIHFPQGMIGFESMQNYTILEIREGAPFLLLQSMDKADLGFLVADPFSFLSDYRITIGLAEQRLLRVQSEKELVILVTASIPPGQPEKTALNLVGPIAINYAARLGLQVPQTGGQTPGKVTVHAIQAECPAGNRPA